MRLGRGFKATFWNITRLILGPILTIEIKMRILLTRENLKTWYVLWKKQGKPGC